MSIKYVGVSIGTLVVVGLIALIGLRWLWMFLTRKSRCPKCKSPYPVTKEVVRRTEGHSPILDHPLIGRRQNFRAPPVPVMCVRCGHGWENNH